MDSSDEDSDQRREDEEAYSHYNAHVDHILESYQKDDLMSLKEHAVALRKQLKPNLGLWMWQPESDQRELIQVLFEILTKYSDTDREIVVESLKIISFLASRGSREALLNIESRLEILFDLLDHSSRIIVKETLEAFAFVALGSWCCLQSVDFDPNIVVYIERFLTVEGNPLSIRRATARLLEKLCIGTARSDLVVPLTNIAARHIRRYVNEDGKVLCALVRAFAKISSKEDKIKNVLETGVTLDICNMLLDECDDDVLQPAFETLTNVMRGTEQEMQTVLEHGVLRALQKYPLVYALNAFEILAERKVHLIIDDQKLMERVLREWLADSSFDFYSILLSLCEHATDEQIKHLVNIPGAMLGLLYGCYDSDSVDINYQWELIEKILRIGRFRCIESCKDVPDKFKNVVRGVMEFHPLQRLLRCPDVRDRADFATLLVGLGCNPNAKVQGTNVSLAKYAFTVSTATGVRLNQLSVLILLLGPAWFQRLCPMHGVWLPRDLWIMFQRYYFLRSEEITENDVPLTALAYNNEDDIVAIEDLEEVYDRITYGPEEKEEESKEHCFY